MPKIILTAVAVLLGLAAVPAGAMSLAPLSAGKSNLVLAAQGCGVGWYRGPWGHCHPMGAGPAYVAPAPVYGAPVYGSPNCWRGYYGHLHCA